MKEFTDILLKDLKPAQRAVVLKLDGNVLVNAGAGTGKTHTLTQRYVHTLLENADIGPRNILAITYTEAAAAELRARIQDTLRLFAQDPALAEEDAQRLTEHARTMDQAWISTIHAFCSRMIRAYAFDLDIDPHFEQLDGEQSAKMRAEIMASFVDDIVLASDSASTQALSRKYFLAMSDDEVNQTIADASDGTLYATLVVAGGDGTTIAKHVADLIDACERSGRTSDDAISQSFEVAIDERHEDAILKAKILIEIARRVESRYAEQKRLRGALDFRDLIVEAHRLLKTNERARENYRARFRYIMIDEFQDTNPLLFEIVSLLEQNNLCLVGDSKQSIFGFSGVDTTLFTELAQEEALKPVQIPLSVNFRSTDEVLSFVNTLNAHENLLGSDMQILSRGRDMDQKPSTLPGHIAPVRMVGVGLHEKMDANEKVATEAVCIAKHFADLVKQGISLRHMAVLVRKHSSANVMLDVFEQYNLPCAIVGGKSFYAEPLVTELLALLKLIRNPHDDQAFIGVALSVVGNLSDELLSELGALLRLRDEQDRHIYHSLFEASVAYTSDPTADAQHRANLTHFIESLDRAIEMVGRYSITEVFTTFYRDRGVFDWWEKRSFRSERDQANFRKFQRIADEASIKNVNLIDFIERIQRAQDEKLESSIGQWQTSANERIRIYTVHKAKGLQFPVVAFMSGSQKPNPQIGPTPFFNDPRPIIQELIAETLDAMDDRIKESAHAQWRHLKDTQGSVIYVVPDGVNTDTRNALPQLFKHVQFSRDFEESKRLFYVAGTRAEDHLIVTFHASDEPPNHMNRNLGYTLTEIVSQDSCELPAEVEFLQSSDGEQEIEPDTNQDKEHAPVEGLPDITLFPIHEPPRYNPSHQLVQVSASQILAYHQCPWKYWWVYGNRLIVNRDTVWRSDHEQERERESTGRHKGTVLHKLLEVMPRDPSPEALDRADVTRIMNAYGIPTAEQPEVLAALEAYRASALNAEVLTHQTIHTEYQFYTAIESYYLYGFMDVMAIDENGNALIVDYKISDSDEDKAESYRDQARIYAYVALKQGAKRVRVVFAQINEAGVEPHEVEPIFTSDDLERLHYEILADITNMQEVQTEPPATQPPHALCAYCQVPTTLCGFARSYVI